MPFVNDMLDSFANNDSDENVEAGSDNASEKDSADSSLSHANKLITRFRFDVDQVMKKLRRRIIGQNRVLDNVEQMLKVIRVDITDPYRPLYVALLLGPTGVGKTEIVRVLAEEIHGAPEAFCRVDMNTLSQEHYAASLTGAPPGYVGSKEGITLLDKEKIEGSYSAPGIVLFDEIEKASDTVIQTLLNVFDNGTMTVTSGQQSIEFRNTIIFMTGNIGALDLQEHLKKQLNEKQNTPSTDVDTSGISDVSNLNNSEIIQESLEKRFAPEFINRIDSILTFNWLSEETLDDIIEIEANRLNQQLKNFGYEMKLTDDARKLLRTKGYDPRYGARALKRAVRQYIEVPLANYLLETENGQHSSLLAGSHQILIARADSTDGSIERLFFEAE